MKERRRRRRRTRSISVAYPRPYQVPEFSHIGAAVSVQVCCCLQHRHTHTHTSHSISRSSHKHTRVFVLFARPFSIVLFLFLSSGEVRRHPLTRFYKHALASPLRFRAFLSCAQIFMENLIRVSRGKPFMFLARQTCLYRTFSLPPFLHPPVAATTLLFDQRILLLATGFLSNIRLSPRV